MQWICGDCRSVNRAGSKRCYKCGALRSIAEVGEATTAFNATAATQATTVLARAARIGARFRWTWPLAVVLVPLILASTSLELAVTSDLIGNLTGSPPRLGPPDPSLSGRPVEFAAVTLLAVVAWSLWTALVTANVPALVGTWPAHGPLGAFFAVFLPIIGFKRPYTVVRDAVRMLTRGAVGPLLVVLAWWWTLLIAWFGPTVILVLGTRGSSPGDSIVAAIRFEQLLYVVAAVLALAVLLVVERAQWHAHRARASAVYLAATSPVD